MPPTYSPATPRSTRPLRPRGRRLATAAWGVAVIVTVSCLYGVAWTLPELALPATVTSVPQPLAVGHPRLDPLNLDGLMLQRSVHGSQRNLFRYGGAETQDGGRDIADVPTFKEPMAAQPEAGTPPSSAVVRLPFRLIGIFGNDTGRVAVLKRDGLLQNVQAGDLVDGRFRVAEIRPRDLELRDLELRDLDASGAENGTLRLRVPGWDRD